MSNICACVSADWFHGDHSILLYSPDCPEHKGLYPGGIVPVVHSLLLNSEIEKTKTSEIGGMDG